MPNYKEDAEFYRFVLFERLCPMEEAIAWCDSVIMAEAEPDPAIIEASLEGSRGNEAVANALRDVESQFEEITVIRRLFRYMRDLIVRDPPYHYPVGVALINMTHYDFDSRLPGVDWSEIWELYNYLYMPDEMAEEYRTKAKPLEGEEVELMLTFLNREGWRDSSR